MLEFSKFRIPRHEFPNVFQLTCYNSSIFWISVLEIMGKREDHREEHISPASTQPKSARRARKRKMEDRSSSTHRSAKKTLISPRKEGSPPISVSKNDVQQEQEQQQQQQQQQQQKGITSEQKHEEGKQEQAQEQPQEQPQEQLVEQQGESKAFRMPPINRFASDGEWVLINLY
ncbi:hypothetical protein AAMO2058_001275100 [Amorphochlora amoebiformis]